LLQIYRETLREWEKGLEEGALTVLSQNSQSSPGRGMLPNSSASSGSSRTASPSRTGGVWVFGEGWWYARRFYKRMYFFPCHTEDSK